jgi:hypothetical protein
LLFFKTKKNLCCQKNKMLLAWSRLFSACAVAHSKINGQMRNVLRAHQFVARPSRTLQVGPELESIVSRAADSLAHRYSFSPSSPPPLPFAAHLGFPHRRRRRTRRRARSCSLPPYVRPHLRQPGPPAPYPSPPRCRRGRPRRGPAPPLAASGAGGRRWLVARSRRRCSTSG